MKINSIENLIDALRCLPGVGPKSAQRMAYYLLDRGRKDSISLAQALTEATSKIGRCKLCRTLTEGEICPICSSYQRDANTLCIVETPIDILFIEQTNAYRGLYFVLMGHLSPLDGIGPNEIGISDLQQRLLTTHFKEVIVATNSTMEGEATAHYIADLIIPLGIKCTRIAHGVPIGGELEYLDVNTISQALRRRQVVNS